MAKSFSESQERGRRLTPSSQESRAESLQEDLSVSDSHSVPLIAFQGLSLQILVDL